MDNSTLRASRSRHWRASAAKPEVAGFRNLPVELVEGILSFCCQSELYAISCASKILHEIATPFLYQHVDVRSKSKDRARIDSFYFSIALDSKLAKHVKSLRIGTDPGHYIQSGRSLSSKLSKERQHMLEQAVRSLRRAELWIDASGVFQDAANPEHEYASFAVLVLHVIPMLHRLEIFDSEEPPQNPLATLLDAVAKIYSTGTSVQSKPFCRQLASIQDIVYNFDRITGRRSSGSGRLRIESIFHLPGARKMELFVPEAVRLSTYQSPLLITHIVLRRMAHLSQNLRRILSLTPQLRSLVCDLLYDATPLGWNTAQNRDVVLIEDLNVILRLVKDTLQVLVLSVECCNLYKAFYEQLEYRQEFIGFLNLDSFLQLHTLEAPIPLITGDYDCSIVNSLGSRLSPSLRHLILRTDLSALQFSASIKDTQEMSYEITSEKVKFELSARMDLAYVFHATRFFLDHLTQLETISIWQPADPDLSWADSQLDDFEVTCKNKSILGKMLYPQIYRKWSRSNWNLVKEVTLFDPRSPERGRYEQLLRGKHSGNVPLGLATFYQLHGLW